MQSREEPLQLKLDTCKSVLQDPPRCRLLLPSLFTFRNPPVCPWNLVEGLPATPEKMLAVQPARGLSAKAL